VKAGFRNSLCLQILFAGVVASLSGGCSLCNNDEVLRVSSPDAKLEAVVFQRDCGATTGFSTQISIVAKGTSLANGGGNLYVADTDHGKAPAANWGGPQVDVVWTDNRTVKVVTHPDARVFHKKTAISISIGIFSKENVKAEYVLKSS